MDRRDLLSAIGVGLAPGLSTRGRSVSNVDYGGEDLRGISSIGFVDGTVQTTAASGGSGGGSLADWISKVYTTEGNTYSATWAGVQAANADLDAAGGGVVYLPTGVTFEPDATVTVGEDVFITGPMASPIRKQQATTAWPRIRPIGDTTPFELTNTDTIRGGLGNMVLDGVNTTSADGLVTSGVVTLERLRIEGFGGSGWLQNGGIDTVARGLELEQNGRAGWEQTASEGNENVTKVFSLRCTGNADYGILYSGGNGSLVFGSTIQGSDVGVAWEGSAGRHMLWGCWTEAWGSLAYDFGSSTASGNTVYHIGTFLSPSDMSDNTGAGPNRVVDVSSMREFNNGMYGRGFALMNLSGLTGNFPGDTRVDDGTNTPSGDPELCIWTGSEWRVSGTNTTFS